MGFLFSKGNAEEYLTNGGILGDKGLVNSGGFKIDTGYIYTSSMDKTEKQAGQGYRGYGAFVKMTVLVIHKWLEKILINQKLIF